MVVVTDNLKDVGEIFHTRKISRVDEKLKRALSFSYPIGNSQNHNILFIFSIITISSEVNELIF